MTLVSDFMALLFQALHFPDQDTETQQCQELCSRASTRSAAEGDEAQAGCPPAQRFPNTASKYTNYRLLAFTQRRF